jgi:hypothetical protein
LPKVGVPLEGFNIDLGSLPEARASLAFWAFSLAMTNETELVDPRPISVLFPATFHMKIQDLAPLCFTFRYRPSPSA